MGLVYKRAFINFKFLGVRKEIDKINGLGIRGG